MAYRVDYGSVVKKTPKQGVRFFRIQLWTILFLLVFVLAVNAAWPAGKAVLMDFLLPGDSGTVQVAFGDLVTDLKTGESFSDAVTVFCRSIMDDAEIQGRD